MSDIITRKGILAGGNFIIDSVKTIDAWPEQDTLCSILSHCKSNGGGPYNILKNLARLDPELPLQACGLLGDDSEARWILEDCKQAGIDTSQLVIRANATTSVTDAMTVASTGRRTFFHARGANAQLSENDFNFNQTRAKIFSLGYLMLLDELDRVAEDGSTGAAKVLRAARKAGLKTAVDCVSTPHPEFKKIAVAALKEADFFFVNELESSWILGYDVTVKNLNSAVRELAQLGCPGITVIHMPQKAAAYSAVEDQLVHHPAVALPTAKIVGTTGAGDAFAAGFLYAVHRDWPLEKCLQSATCVAAMSLSHATPSAGITKHDNCMNLGEIYGYGPSNHSKAFALHQVHR